MRRLPFNFVSALLVGILSSLAFAQGDVRVRAAAAAQYAGEFAEVCGVIADTNYARRSRGSPTYLNFDQPFPDHVFTAIVWGKDRKHFDVKPEDLKGHKACVYGKVELYKGKPQIVIVRPQQIASVPPKTASEEQD